MTSKDSSAKCTTSELHRPVSESAGKCGKALLEITLSGTTIKKKKKLGLKTLTQATKGRSRRERRAVSQRSTRSSNWNVVLYANSY